MTHTVKSVLESAKALIADPSNWCQGHYALDASGNVTDRYGPDGVQFCGYGALDRATMDMDPETKERALRRLQEASGELYDDGVACVNDHRGHEAILRVYDHAISNSK